MTTKTKTLTKRKTKKNKVKEGLGVVDLICKRKKRRLYTLLFVAGLPGSGKSSTCLRLGELVSLKLLGENIITKKNILDDFVELVKFIKDANPKELNIGVIEEVSVLFPSRRAMAGENVDINRVLDTARKKEVILLANAPLWNSIDSHMRALGNIYLEAIKIDKRNRWVISKPLGIQTNPKSGKTYYHYLNYKGREVHRIVTKKPKKKTWDDYEKRKDKFMDDIYAEAIHKKQRKQEKMEREMKKKEKEKELEIKKQRIYEASKKGLSQRKIAKDFDYSQPRIKQIIDEMKEKMEKKKKNT